MTSSLGPKLELISLAMFVAYGAVVLAGILPLSLLDSAWQLRFSRALVDNAALPLVGVAILHVAVHLDGSRPSLLRLHSRVSHWLLPVALGFLLLVPLQAVSVWRLYRSDLQAQGDNQAPAVTRRFEQMRQAIEGATTPADLQTRLRAAGGPSLPAAVLAQPMPQMRRGLLASLEQAKRKETERFSSTRPSILWVLVQRSLQGCVAALAYAVAFGGSAQRQGSEQTRLQEWLATRRARSRWAAQAPPKEGFLAALEKWGARQEYRRKHRAFKKSDK